MKKIFKFLAGSALLFSAVSAHALTGTFVQITTGTLQPNTTNGFYVSSGTAQNFTSYNMRSTGTFTLDKSTTTGLRVDQSTINFTGTITVSSGTINSFTAQSGTMTFVKIGTATQNMGMNDSNKIVRLAAGSTAGDSIRYEQMKVVSWNAGTRNSAFATTGATFQGAASSCTITPASASNSVAVFVTATLDTTASGAIVFLSIGRNGTNIGGTNGINWFTSSAINTDAPGTAFIIDAPGTTSATLYEPMIRTTSGTASYCGANALCTTLCVELAP